MDDAALVVSAQAGDSAAFDELARRHRRAAMAMAIHLTGDVVGAEDVVQDSLAVAFEKIAGLRDPERFKAWLYTIVRRMCVRERRVRPRGQIPLDDVPEPAAGQDISPLENGILNAMNDLPRSYRELLAARYLAEMSYEEMARMFGVAEGAVRVRVFRAKQRLRKCLECLEREASEASRYELR